MKLTALKCADKSWAQAGFAEIKGGLVSLKDVDILLADKNTNGKGGLQAWGWDDLPAGVTSICGIPAFKWTKTTALSENPNGVLSIDHVVLHTNNPERVKQDFKGVGIDLRKERSDIYPGITQLFFRPGGGPVIEVVSNKDFPENFLWGTTLVVSDIGRAKAFLRDNASEPKKAVQPGRQIMTVRHAKVGMDTNMAMMTPHVVKSSSKL